jgi:hypothetical protein
MRRQAKGPNCFRDARNPVRIGVAQEEKEGSFRGGQSVISEDNIAQGLILEAAVEHKVAAS